VSGEGRRVDEEAWDVRVFTAAGGDTPFGFLAY
jgi:hypothetical protein